MHHICGGENKAMSEVPSVFQDSPVFTNPTAAPDLTYSNPAQVVLQPGKPVELQGSSVQITTVANTNPATPVQLVVNGINNTVNLGTGSAQVNVVGGGAIVEAVQLLNANGVAIADAGKVINLGGGSGTDSVAYNGGVVNTTAVVSGNTPGTKVSIATAAGGITPSGTTGFAYYTHGGTGNDTIFGSSLADFIRGGAGNDLISALGGNDLVRGGSGSDNITLGQGVDTLYYTSDQINRGDVDTVTDFTSGEDKVAVEKGINATISADGKSILLTLQSGGATTTLISQKDLFKTSDINFLA